MADLDVDDISQLERLDNNSIRQVLKRRYVKDKMYTNCGDILIAVNPYKDLNIFDGKKHEEYSWKSLHHVHPPHVFHMAARAYRRLQETRTNQVILVGGESGAGKTENAKYIVKHLMAMCPQKSDHLHQRIIKVNPLLEAFGNAKTTLNENSSRFAKYLELAFSVDGQIKGAIVRDYLLEKSRVVNQADKEGNFHIFYSLFAGAPTAMLKSLRLKDAQSYRILQRNKDLLSRREFYRVLYLEQMEVLKSLDMDQQDIDVIHTVLAAILHITQVEFIEPEDPNQPLQIRDISVLKNVADLLTVPYEELGHSLIATKQTFAGEVIVKRKSMCQAIDSRDAFAKALYERLFGWIVRQINMNLYPLNTRLNDTGGFVRIGILDIAGFENLTFNSLEQMCINLTNEKLQSFTNMNTVDFEMSLYKEEGIQIPDIKYKKDDAVLNMFMKKTFGVLPLLDEESKLAQGSNDRLIKNMKDQYENLECFMASPSNQAVFGVKHFAGQVWYDASMLIEKNRDMLSPDLITCMKQSTNPFVSDLFTAKKGPTGTISATVHKIRKSKKEAGARPTESAGRPTLTPDLGATLQMRYGKIESSTSIVFSPKDQRTVISYFQTSMNELLSKLKQAEPHYVRCIKPNTFLQPDNFDDEKVVQQIVYNGISEVAKIRTLGLPVRKRYDVFTKRYGSLFPQSRTAVSPRAGTYLLLQKILPSYMMPGIRFGNTKVFMKEDVSMLLEQCRVIRDRTAANCIAKHWQEHYQNRRRHQDEAKTQLTTASYVSSPEWETSTPARFKTSFDSKSWEASTPESSKTSFDSKSWEASTPESSKTSFDSKSWEASTPESSKTSFDSKSWEASTPESSKTFFDSKSWEASTPESSKTSFDSKSWEASTPESFKTSFDSKSWEASTPARFKTSFDSKSWEASTPKSFKTSFDSKSWEASTPESSKTSFDSKSWEASTPARFKTSFDSKSWEASTPESSKTSFDSKSWEASTPESSKTSFDSKSWEASTPESSKTSFDSKSWEASTPESSKTSFDSKSWEASTPESFKTSFDSKSWEASTPARFKTSFDSKSWEASTPKSFKTSFDSKSWEASTPESSKTCFDSKRSIGKEEDYTFFNWSVNTNLKNSISYKTYTDRKPKKKKAPTPPAVSSILKNINGTEEEQNQASKIPKKLKKEFWDIFHIINRETKRDSFNIGGVMRTLKIFTYILLGLLLLACSVFQKISLVTLVSDTSKFQHVLLLVVTCIPYIRLFLTSVWTSLFGNVPFPSKKNVVIVLISEGLHSVGLSLMIFRVLPEIDVVRSILLLSCACITPSILKPFCSSTKDSNTQCKSKAGEMFIFAFDILAALIQISVIPVIVLTDYYINNAHFAENDWKIVEMGFALILCSLPYWENFVDDRFCGALNETNSLQILILGLKFDLQECRPVLYAIAAPIKILITGLLAFYLNEQEYRSDLQFLSLFTEVWSTELFTDIPIVLALSAFVGHFVAYTACKVNMQIFSFAVPLLVSTPLAAYILYADCQSHVLPGIFKEERICDGDLLKTWWHLPIAGGWLISVYWIGRHIWFPSQPRLSNLETLFLNPVYCGVLMEQDLIMKRRRHKRKIFKVISKGRTFYRLKPDDMRDSNLEDKETTDVISPMVYACATMWHETRQEMVQLLKSLFRMDKDQFLRKKAITTFDVTPADVDYYEYEPHIFFDDAFETNADNERVPNSFVNEMVAVMEEAASSVHEKALTINDAIKIPTPYGGQLVFLMPGGNFLFVHLKDKKKIRNKKRWSQVMYMYYLLGYRILKECQEVVLSAINRDDFNQLISWRKFQKENTGKVEKSQIFSFLDDEVLYRAQNTFLLALDGDVEFSPEAVHLLIDKLKKNDRVGAVSGRIHPVGKGPVVWFQTFEYAMGHWLQKATEHVIGCVLCSPGCFSMFRGSSLMDDNVMRKFTILPSEPSHYLMYDQGEDRWLCTLLLQQGYRVEYAAAADAFTYAPEGFEEFFNQRRRWIPSTIANIMELLQDGKNTVAINNNISWFYIAYQYFLMAATVLGPGVIVMMIAGAFGSVFGTDITTAYLLATLPAVLYIFLCFNATPKSQIIAAQILGVCYIFVMTVVFIGCLIIATQENALHPSVIFIESLIILTFLTACFHPHEFGCIMHGALYYLCIPLGYLLLVTYSLCNMHIISWGTRESQEKKTPHEIAEEEKLRKEKEERKKQGFLARLMPKLGFSDIVDVLTKIRLKNNRIDGRVDILRAMNKKIELLLKQKQNVGIGDDIDMQDAEVIPEVVVLKKPSPTIEKTVRFDGIPISSHREEVDELGDAMNSNTKTEMLSPNWEKLHTLGNGRILKLNPAEEDFWKSLIKRYLYPLNLSAASQKQIKTRLLEFRNSSCAAIAILNLVWIAINFMFQLRKPAMIYFAVPSDVDDADVNTENFQVDVLGMLFVLFFSLMILIQFIGMLVHRWGTFLHLISITFIPNPFQRKVEDTDIENGNSKYVAEKLLEFCGKLDSERISYFPMNSDDEEEEEEQVIGAMVEVINNIQVKGTKSIPGSTNPLGKSIRQSGIGISSNRKTSAASILVKSVIRRTTVRENRLLDINVEKKTEKSSNTFKDTSKDNPRLRSGASMPFQRHFMSAVRNRKLPNIPEDFLKKERLSQTLRRDGYDPDAFDDSEEDSDPIYDTIPAVGVMDKAFSMKLKKYRHQEQRSQLNGTWRSELNAL